MEPTGEATIRDKADLGQAGHRIREHLDSQWVLRAALEEVARALEPEEATVWMGGGQEPPEFCYGRGRAGEVGHPGDTPAAVLASARRWQVVVNEGGDDLAVPAFAPRSGVVAIFHLRGGQWGASDVEFAEALAAEAGLAYEAAVVYERAVAEKDKSETVLARVADGVVVTDRRGVILQLNPAARRIARFDGRDAVGLPCQEVLALQCGDQPLNCADGCGLLVLQARQGDVADRDVWRELPDGRKQPLLADAEAIRGPDGTVSEVVHSLRDITRLKEADEAKTLFLATASHELKTPLTVIKGFAQTLITQPDLDPDVKRQALVAIERRAGELSRIVDRLLLSSRIESGRLEVAMHPVDVPALLAERVDSIAAATGRQVGLLVDGEVPRALADPDALTTIADHLLDNAIKYSPSGDAVVVSVTAPGDIVEIRVTDLGVGMDPEQIERCFEKFWQAESTEIRRFGGTGIGLYIVRSMVEAMAGSITVESTLGSGTTFCVTLRAAP
jgi:PAS domain S-box-containing protein